MLKRGQISIFLIIGIVIVVALGVFIALKTNVRDIVKGPGFYGGVNDVRRFVDACISDVSDNGIKIIGLQGGYYEVPFILKFTHVDGTNTDITYGYDYFLDQSWMPATLNVVEEELIKYIKLNMLGCVDSFKAFYEDGYNVKTRMRDMYVDVNFLEDGTQVDVKWKIELEKGDNRAELFDFGIKKFPYRLKKMYNIERDIVNNFVSGDYPEVDVSYLINQNVCPIADECLFVSEERLVFMLTDTYKGKEFNYVFAA